VHRAVQSFLKNKKKGLNREWEAAKPGWLTADVVDVIRTASEQEGRVFPLTCSGTEGEIQYCMILHCVYHARCLSDLVASNVAGVCNHMLWILAFTPCTLNTHGLPLCRLPPEDTQQVHLCRSSSSNGLCRQHRLCWVHAKAPVSATMTLTSLQGSIWGGYRCAGLLL
jgi:hypothetical protein